MNKINIYLVSIIFLFSLKLNTLFTQVEHSASYISTFHSGVRNKLNGEFEKAIANFTICLNSDKNDDAVHYALAQIFLIKKDLQQASFHTKRALEIDPKNKYYQIEMAYMYGEIGNYTQAAKIFEELIKKDIKNSDLYWEATTNWTKAKNINKALDVLEKFEYNLGPDPIILLEKVYLLEIINQDKQALSLLLSGNKQFPGDPSILSALVDFYYVREKFSEVKLFLSELLKVDPSNGLALILLAEMQFQDGEIIESNSNFKKALKANGLEIAQRMDILFQLKDRPEIEQSELTELINFMVLNYPKEAKAHSIKGDHYFNLNQPLIAIESYKNAVACDPNLFPIWSQIILLEYENEEWDSLSVDSEKAIAYFPAEPMVYFLSGVASNNRGEFEKSEQRLLSSLDFLVDNLSLESEINCQLGISYFGLKKNELAKIKFEKSIQLAPENNLMKQIYAIQLAKNQIDFVKANQLVDNLLIANGNDYNSLVTKGRVLFYEKKFEQSLTVLLRLISDSQNDPKILDYTGDCYFFLGDIIKAVKFWEDAKLAGSKNKSIDLKINNKIYND